MIGIEGAVCVGMKFATILSVNFLNTKKDF